MNSILFIGYSNFVKARILPIVETLGFQSVSIAKFSGQNWDDELNKYKFPIQLYDNYEDGIRHFQGNMVYISTVNSTHYQYAQLSLERGFHVVIDKPATTQLQETVHLIQLAKKKNLLIAEATVYLMHPQFSLIDRIFSRNDDSPKLITACLSMPPFKDDNFRYKKELGGGAILDTAPYAVSLGRHFFKTLPVHVQCAVNEKMNDDLEIAYSLIMKYNNGKCLIGHFGFNTEYTNQLMIMGSQTNVSFNRVFTIPDHLENVIHMAHQNVSSEERSKAGNNYRLFLEKYLYALEMGHHEDFYADMLLDAQAKNMIMNNII